MDDEEKSTGDEDYDDGGGDGDEDDIARIEQRMQWKAIFDCTLLPVQAKSGA